MSKKSGTFAKECYRICFMKHTWRISFRSSSRSTPKGATAIQTNLWSNSSTTFIASLVKSFPTSSIVFSPDTSSQPWTRFKVLRRAIKWFGRNLVINSSFPSGTSPTRFTIIDGHSISCQKLLIVWYDNKFSPLYFTTWRFACGLIQKIRFWISNDSFDEI